ncbi:Swi5-domain-containing protein [Leptodontidium sp. 2 PMI_412]|nr:Swi5-domain-containing protein [Leptodontidium sp. 2 PMI_412]
MAKVDGGLDLQLPVSVHSDKVGEVTVEHVSLKQHTVQDASGTGVSPADQEDGTVSTPPEDEDTVMSDETFQHRETEAKDGRVSPVQKAATAGVEIQAGASDPKTTASMTARSIPDSEDDEELPDSEPIVKEVEDSQATLPMISQSASIELAESNERDVDATEAASSKKSTSTFKPPPKTPKTSFKAPSLSTTTESQYTEPTSSPLKPEVTTSTPSKENKEEDKTPPKSFTATDVSQNKDILMAELKAIKIASIQARNASLEVEIKKKKARLEEVTKELNYPAAETVKNHIKLLHDYNDIRDVGQGLVGMIADNRGVRIGELYEEFGVGLKD